jgi:hypothetical protein
MGEGVATRPDQASLGMLVSAAPRDAVDGAVAACGAGRGVRARTPAHVITYLTLALSLLPDDYYAEVLRRGRRTATGTADIPPRDWDDHLPGSRYRSSSPAVNGPARARSHAPDTTASGSRNLTNRPAPAAKHRPRSTSASSNPDQQHDQVSVPDIDPGLANPYHGHPVRRG